MDLVSICFDGSSSLPCLKVFVCFCSPVLWWIVSMCFLFVPHGHSLSKPLCPYVWSINGERQGKEAEQRNCCKPVKLGLLPISALWNKDRVSVEEWVNALIVCALCLGSWVSSISTFQMSAMLGLHLSLCSVWDKFLGSKNAQGLSCCCSSLTAGCVGVGMLLSRHFWAAFPRDGGEQPWA